MSVRGVGQPRTRASVALVVALALPVGIVPFGVTAACAAGSSAAVHVVFPDGREVAKCVPISDEITTGTDALRATGLQVTSEEFPGSGSLVCAIEGVGANFPEDPCVPPCPTGRCLFWAYMTRAKGGEWGFSSIGASMRTLRDGDSDLWVFGSHTTTSVEDVPNTTDGVCDQGAQPTAVGGRGSFPLKGFASFGLAAIFAFGAARRMRRRAGP